MSYRFAFDLGTNSAGWVVYALDARGSEPRALEDLGVRIFSDGREPIDKTSRNATRREKRGMRRNRDRRLSRAKRMLQALIRLGLLPTDESERRKLADLDPYEWRAKGLDEKLSPYALGRIIHHLNKRRGFKSNRKTDGGDKKDKETGALKSTICETKKAIEAKSKRTAGEYLATLHEDRQSVRARPRGEGKDKSYDVYFDRATIAQEFDSLWAAQARYHPALLTDEARDKVRDILLYQRDLRPQIAGKCTFHPEEKRAPLALPLSERFRIYQDLNHLRFGEVGQQQQPLTSEQRDLLAAELLKGKDLTWEKIGKLLKLDIEEVRFNLQSDRRKELKGDETAKRLAAKKCFDKAWHTLSLDQQNEVVERLLNEENRKDWEETLTAWLRDRFDLSDEAAEAAANTRLRQGHGRLGRTALQKIVEPLQADVVTYAEAARRAGYHHSDERDGEIFDALPYYGRVLERHVAFDKPNPRNEEEQYGKIANPTVHVALNQLQTLANALVRKYGRPAEIVVEVAREITYGPDKRSEMEREQTGNQAANDKRRKELEGLNQTVNAENILRLRLWEELNRDNPLDRRCPYSGEQISIHRLFTDEVEIEHILPRSRTLDNSPANKTLSMRWANRMKVHQTPWEAFHTSPHPKLQWAEIVERAKALPKNKGWRFAEDAMNRFEKEHDFLARQLHDTRYIARLAKAYLSKLCDPDRDRVWVTPGRLTALLRGHWGLNSLLSDHNRKNRYDHRHHAIDAAVIGLTDRGLLQRISTAAAQAEEKGLQKILATFPSEPWEGFREEMKEKLARVIVSHKPDHGTGGALHEETNYGIIKNPQDWDGHTLVTRKAVTQLTPGDIERIRDATIREALQAAIKGLDTKSFKQTLQAFSETQFRGGNPIRRVRLMKKEAEFIRIHDRKNGTPYRAVISAGNHHVDFFVGTDGKVDFEPGSYFEVNQKGYRPKWLSETPRPRFLMRLHLGDLLQIEHEGRQKIMRVVSLRPANKQIVLAEHFEGGPLQKRHDKKEEDHKEDPFRFVFPTFSQLLKMGAKRINLDPLGHIRIDPGKRFLYAGYSPRRKAAEA